jgi:hypothetical protein
MYSEGVLGRQQSIALQAGQNQQGLQWLNYLYDEVSALKERQPEYRWPRQILEYIRQMRATVVASKLVDINTTLDNSIMDTSADRSRIEDNVQRRTFKYLSDFFWTNMSTQRRQEVASAKMRHDSIRLSNVGDFMNSATPFESKLSPTEDMKQKLCKIPHIFIIIVFSQSSIGDSAAKAINNTSLLGASNTTGAAGQVGYVDVNRFIKDREGSVSMK